MNHLKTSIVIVLFLFADIYPTETENKNSSQPSSTKSDKSASDKVSKNKHSSKSDLDRHSLSDDDSDAAPSQHSPVIVLSKTKAHTQEELEEQRKLIQTIKTLKKMGTTTIPLEEITQESDTQDESLEKMWLDLTKQAEIEEAAPDAQKTDEILAMPLQANKIEESSAKNTSKSSPTINSALSKNFSQNMGHAESIARSQASSSSEMFDAMEFIRSFANLSEAEQVRREAANGALDADDQAKSFQQNDPYKQRIHFLDALQDRNYFHVGLTVDDEDRSPGYIQQIRDSTHNLLDNLRCNLDPHSDVESQKLIHQLNEYKQKAARNAPFEPLDNNFTLVEIPASYLTYAGRTLIWPEGRTIPEDFTTFERLQGFHDDIDGQGAYWNPARAIPIEMLEKDSATGSVRFRPLPQRGTPFIEQVLGDQAHNHFVFNQKKELEAKTREIQRKHRAHLETVLTQLHDRITTFEKDYLSGFYPNDKVKVYNNLLYAHVFQKQLLEKIERNLRDLEKEDQLSPYQASADIADDLIHDVYLAPLRKYYIETAKLQRLQAYEYLAFYEECAKVTLKQIKQEQGTLFTIARVGEALYSGHVNMREKGARDAQSQQDAIDDFHRARGQELSGIGSVQLDGYPTLQLALARAQTHNAPQQSASSNTQAQAQSAIPTQEEENQRAEHITQFIKTNDPRHLTGLDEKSVQLAFTLQRMKHIGPQIDLSAYEKAKAETISGAMSEIMRGAQDEIIRQGFDQLKGIPVEVIMSALMSEASIWITVPANLITNSTGIMTGVRNVGNDLSSIKSSIENRYYYQLGGDIVRTIINSKDTLLSIASAQEGIKGINKIYSTHFKANKPLSAQREAQISQALRNMPYDPHIAAAEKLKNKRDEIVIVGNSTPQSNRPAQTEGGNAQTQSNNEPSRPVLNSPFKGYLNYFLKTAEQKFGNVPGSNTGNGPLKNLQNALDTNNAIRIHGATYELAKAIELERQGEKIVRFGTRLGGVEYDIETAQRLIECKTINWSYYKALEGLTYQDVRGNPQLEKLYKTWNDQKTRIVAKQLEADQANKQFELHSQNKIPDFLKAQLVEKKIKVVDE